MSKVSYTSFGGLGRDLDVLNWVLLYIKHSPVKQESALSNLDYIFFEWFFRTTQMRNLVEEYKELEKRRRELSQSFLNIFLKEIKPIDQMGMIERQFYFKWIIDYGQKFSSFQIIFHNASSWEYSEEKFTLLYKWYKSWCLKSKEDIELEEKKAIHAYFNSQPIKIKRCPDEETAIMSALKNGNGDAFGFD